jgi:hypothetical protein
MKTLKTLAVAAALAVATIAPANAESVTHRCRYSGGSTAAECTVPAAAHWELSKAANIVVYIDRCPNKATVLTPMRIDEARKLWSTLPVADREAWIRGHDRAMAEALTKYGKPELSAQEDACELMRWVIVPHEHNPVNTTPWRDYLIETIQEGR